MPAAKELLKRPQPQTKLAVAYKKVAPTFAADMTSDVPRCANKVIAVENARSPANVTANTMGVKIGYS